MDPSDEAESSNAADKPANASHGRARFDADEAREVALRAELDGLRGINEVIEGVVSSLDRAKQNMEVVSRTVASASTLLNTWIRILSQTEHNQRLILNPGWQGASQDIADLENESLLKQQAAERREIEEQQRREAAAQKAEEEERRRGEASSVRGTRGSKGRGRGSTRGTTTTGPGYMGVGGQVSRGLGRGSSTGTRGTSGIGRGVTSTRGRGRGAP